MQNTKINNVLLQFCGSCLQGCTVRAWSKSRARPKMFRLWTLSRRSAIIHCNYRTSYHLFARHNPGDHRIIIDILCSIQQNKYVYRLYVSFCPLKWLEMANAKRHDHWLYLKVVDSMIKLRKTTLLTVFPLQFWPNFSNFQQITSYTKKYE